MKEEKTVGYLIKSINDELEKKANNELRADDMTISQVGVLLQLQQARDGILTVSELVKRLHLAQPTVTGLINRLEKKKYVKILGDTEDKRIRNVLITEKGRECCENGKRNMKETEGRLLRALNEEQRKELIFLLEKVKNDFLN